MVAHLGSGKGESAFELLPIISKEGSLADLRAAGIKPSSYSGSSGQLSLGCTFPLSGEACNSASMTRVQRCPGKGAKQGARAAWPLGPREERQSDRHVRRSHPAPHRPQLPVFWKNAPNSVPTKRHCGLPLDQEGVAWVHDGPTLCSPLRTDPPRMTPQD